MGLARVAKKKLYLEQRSHLQDCSRSRDVKGFMDVLTLESLGRHSHSHGRNGLSPGTDPTATAVVPRARDDLDRDFEESFPAIIQSDDATEHDGSKWPTTGTLACDMSIKHGHPVTRRHHLRAWSRDGYLEACDKAVFCVFCPPPGHLECLPYEAVSPLSLSTF